MQDNKISNSQCRHYWIIEPPHGPTSMGRCKYCGKVQEFSNGLPDITNIKQSENNLVLSANPN